MKTMREGGREGGRGREGENNESKRGKGSKGKYACTHSHMYELYTLHRNESYMHVNTGLSGNTCTFPSLEGTLWTYE